MHISGCVGSPLAARDATDAVTFLRHAISAFNEVTGVENTATSGDHETLTRYFVDAVSHLAAPTIDDVIDSPLCATDAPLQYWSGPRLFSRMARAAWVEPDLAPLPWVHGSHQRDRHRSQMSLRSSSNLD